jgi:hypothetical protein
MPARIWAEWIAYYNLEPWGEERADWRAGMVAATIANAHRDPKKHAPFRPADFMPRFQRPTEEGGQMDWRLMKQSLEMAIAAAEAAKGTHGGDGSAAGG